MFSAIPATLVIPGREETPKAAYREPGIPTCFALNTPRFRAQSGPLRGPSCPGMTSLD
jgi:hypothetical protein